MLYWWLILILLVYFFVCLLLIGVILIQSGKGGGLSSLAQSTGGISDALGATGAERTLNKITSFIAVSFMVLAIFLSIATSCNKQGHSASKLLGEPSPTKPNAPGATAPAVPPANQTGDEIPVQAPPAPAPPANPPQQGANAPATVSAPPPAPAQPAPASPPAAPAQEK